MRSSQCKSSLNNKTVSSNEKLNVEHLDEKDLKIIKVKRNNFIEKPEEYKDDDEILQPSTSNESSFDENWRGLIVPPKKRMKSSYLTPRKELMKINFNEYKQNRPIGLLRNGNLNIFPILMDKDKYIVSNTCVFDCLAQIFASSIIDSDKYAKYFENIQNDLFLEITKDIAEAKINQKTYKNRVRLLKTLCKTQLFPSGIIRISSETTVSYLAQNLFKRYPSAIPEFF